jgi:hypothetical protein
MQGEDLDRWIRQRASMTEGVTEVTASEIAKSLLSAVDHMHKRNIIHRDLKVSNIRITVRFTERDYWHNVKQRLCIEVQTFLLARLPP